MQIQLNTGPNVQGDQRLNDYVESVVSEGLEKFSSQITRVEVHISDQNADKGGQADKQCSIEARLAGLKPTAVTSQAETVDLAISTAVDKLQSLIETTLGKLNKR